MWLRVERQTLRKLPQTGAIAFTVRILQCPLAQLAASPALNRQLLHEVGRLKVESPAMYEYKSMASLAAPVSAYLRSVQSEGERPA